MPNNLENIANDNPEEQRSSVKLSELGKVAGIFFSSPIILPTSYRKYLDLLDKEDKRIRESGKKPVPSPTIHPVYGEPLPRTKEIMETEARVDKYFPIPFFGALMFAAIATVGNSLEYGNETLYTLAATNLVSGIYEGARFIKKKFSNH